MRRQRCRLRRLGGSIVKKKHIAARALKALAIAAALSLIALVVVAQRAEAQVVDELWNVGESFGPLLESEDRSGAPRTVVINGAEVTIRSESLAEDLESTLERAERNCAGLKLGPKSTTFRRQVRERGFVACFTRLGRLGLRGLFQVARGDVSALGEFHYTYVQTTATGVHQLRLELPQIDLGAMFPATGDAPGYDVRDLPRPPSAERLLSALEVDSPYHVAVYRLPSVDFDALVETYQQKLSAFGWALASGGNTDRRVSLVARRDSKTAIITLRATDAGALVTVGTGL